MNQPINPNIKQHLSPVIDYFKTLQAGLHQLLIEQDSSLHNQSDAWESKLGSGYTRTYSQGKIFEKAAINFSKISAPALPRAATKGRTELVGQPYSATGVSLVLHPQNPYSPIVHCNVRFFITQDKAANPIWWFGGGLDLTPIYGFLEDIKHWHETASQICEPFGNDVYPLYKKQCDEYFYLPHRKEQRGVGGLFFDDLNAWGFAKSFEFTQRIGDNFWAAYEPIVSKRYETPYGQREKLFQLYRRARYVEFNLLYDRGTLFGLQSGGRVESILVSMPPQASWSYNWQPEPGSPEAELTEKFLQPKDWLNETT